MAKSEKVKIRDNLFSFRYADLVLIEDQLIDNISGNVTFSQKKHLTKVMCEFAEPVELRESRYSNETVDSNVLEYSIDYFNDLFDYPHFNVYGWIGAVDSNVLAGQFTPFLFDVIELQYKFLSKDERKSFAKLINQTLEDDGVAFCLKNGQINQRVDTEVYFDLPTEKMTKLEQGLHDLINEAITKHRQSNSSARRDAVEKLWDALERLKTYYSTNKKHSVKGIISDMSNGNEDFRLLFDAEFNALTEIGNKYRIRHHEIGKIEITDIRYYDYFFNRCLALIATALQYLK